MAPKTNPRNWNDVQTAIAAVAVVTTLGMWNLFAAPDAKKSAQAQPVAPVQPAAQQPAVMPQVKVFFTTPTAPRPASAPQQQTINRRQNNNGGGNTVTKTKTS